MHHADPASTRESQIRLDQNSRRNVALLLGATGVLSETCLWFARPRLETLGTNLLGQGGTSVKKPQVNQETGAAGSALPLWMHLILTPAWAEMSTLMLLYATEMLFCVSLI